MSTKTVEELRDQVVSLMEEYHTQLKVLDMRRQSELLKEKMEEFQQGIFQVLFTGTFNAGKSTTLNAIMRQKLLGTSINPETPIITRVVNGKNNNEVIISYRDKRPDVTMSLEQFKNEFRLDAKIKDKFKEILYATIERKLPVDTVIFVDSPGLDNTDVDDFIATEYAGKAEAVVFIMSATAALKKTEREYIQKHYEHKNRKGNVFVVVNWWNAVQPGDEEAVKERIKNELRLVFEDENGVFNEELYRKRVFYVDSHTCECYRTGTEKKVLVGRKEITVELNEDDDASSGIPEFETALMEFLSSSDKDKVGYMAYMSQMAGMYKESCDSVARRKKASIESLEELKKTEETLSDNIEKLTNILDGIESVFDNTINTVMLNAGSSYDDFVRSVENNWDQYFASRDVDFGMLQGAQILGQKVKNTFGKIGRWFTGEEEDEIDKIARDMEFQKIVRPIADVIQEYIEQESMKMGDNIMAKSEMAIKRMNKSLEEYSKDLEEMQKDGVDLRELLKELGKGSNVNVDAISGDTNLAQLLISILLFGNVDDAVGNVLAGGDGWASFIKKTILTEITEIVIATVVVMLTGTWIIYIIGRVIYGMFKLNTNVKNLGSKILLDPEHKTRNEIVNGLRNERASTLAGIEVQFNKKVKGSHKRLTKGLKDDMSQKQEQLRKLISQRKQKGFDAQKEAQTLERAKGELLKIYNKMAHLLEGRTYKEQAVLDNAVSTIVQ